MTTCIVVNSGKESYGCEDVFGANVDYFGDPYRTRGSPRKQREKPLRSICKELWLGQVLH